MIPLKNQYELSLLIIFQTKQKTTKALKKLINNDLLSINLIDLKRKIIKINF